MRQSGDYTRRHRYRVSVGVLLQAGHRWVEAARRTVQKAVVYQRLAYRHTLRQRLQRGHSFNRYEFAKKYAVHGAFVALVVSAAAYDRVIADSARTSLLYELVAGDEVVEGPLDPSAYAQTDMPGVGGARVAAIDATSAGIELITFDDPEVDFAATLGGNAVIAPLSPIVPEPASDSRPKPKRPTIYTVQENDTIASIAAAFNVSTNTVLWANGLSEQTVLKVGDHITILPTTGVQHTVSEGDTVLAIANRYDAAASEIIAFNGLGEDAKLAIGLKLIVPDGYIEPRSVPTIVPSTRLAADSDEPTPEPAPATGKGFIWPTATRHIAQYFRWGHTGIDIDNRSRPPIYAAADGTVEFAGWLGGYGNLLIVNHGNGLETYYAHLEKFYVSKGQHVGKGVAIAKMGSTGRSSGPHLHFEVRRGGRPVNPMAVF